MALLIHNIHGCSLTSVMNICRPAIEDAAKTHGILISIAVDFPHDTIRIITATHKSSGAIHQGVFLTRAEIDDNIWVDIAADRLARAIEAVKLNPAALEYDEIMQAQEIMDDLQKSP